MKIKVTSVYVDDQNKALRFYTEVLGFAKKADFSQGPFRWLEDRVDTEAARLQSGARRNGHGRRSVADLRKSAPRRR